MPGREPSWQREPCPGWCMREHDESDPALDRFHQGEASLLPALISVEPAGPRGATFAPVDLTLRLGRYVDEVIDWVAIEPLPSCPRLVLTTESAGRLAQRIDELAIDAGRRESPGIDRVNDPA